MLPLAPLLLILALVLPAAAQQHPPSGMTAPKPDAPQREYRDSRGNVVTDPEILKILAEREGKVMGPDGNLAAPPQNLPEYARKAMEAGMTPVLDHEGNVLGFDDPAGAMAWLPDAVQKLFGGNEPPPGITSGDVFSDPQLTYKRALEQEKHTGKTMVWDGMAMVPAPEGFRNPLTPDAMAAGWRPVVVNGEVVGACDGSQCTSQALQPNLFTSQ